MNFCCFGKIINLHGEYPQHLMDPLNSQAVQVGEHAHYVRQEDRELRLPLVAAAGGQALLLALLACVDENSRVFAASSDL